MRTRITAAGAALATVVLGMVLWAGVAPAEDGSVPDVAASVQIRGPETGLPIPRYVSMKAGEGNVRRGPSREHRIDWVYMRRDLPLQVVAEHAHWRRVRDRDGKGGWMHYSLLSGVRTALVEAPVAEMRMRPSADAQVVAELHRGVVARIDRCLPSWCRLTKDRVRGWVEKSALWGVVPGEIVE